MNEKAPEEVERGNALRMSSPGKRVARKLGSERMCPAEYMGSGARCTLAWRCPGARGDKGAALRRAVSCALRRSVHAHDVRRTGAREKVCSLPTRMLLIVLDRQVSREKRSDPEVQFSQLSCQLAPPRIHSWRGKHWHCAQEVSSLKCAVTCSVAGNQERRGLAAYAQLARSSNRRWPHAVGPRGVS